MKNSSNKTVSAIIPAYNEEERIADTIAGLSGIAGITEIVVVDDGSCDRTAERAAGVKVKLLRNEKNMGKGGSMERGLRESSGDVVVFLDADLGTSSADAANLIRPVLDGECDMAIADFYGGKGRKGGFGIVLGTAALGLKVKTGQDFRSPISGQRAMTREAALALCPIRAGFGAEVGLTIRAHALGLRIMEVPVEMTHKATGRTLRGFAHRGKQLAHIVATIITEPSKRRPD